MSEILALKEPTRMDIQTIKSGPAGIVYGGAAESVFPLPIRPRAVHDAKKS
jgi:hypothetical protein